MCALGQVLGRVYSHLRAGKKAFIVVMIMKGVVRSSGSFVHSLLGIALLQSALVSHLSVTISAAKFHGDELAEFERSMARYRSPIENDYSASSMRDLLQVEEKESKSPEQAEEKVAGEPAFEFPEPYLLGTEIKDWDEQRQSYLKANPSMKSPPDGKPRVLIVTGSQPEPCNSPVGDHFHLKALKLKIDYARMHNYEIYYNFVHQDPLFDTYWVKLPTIRSLMLSHPEIEWFIWADSDAVFTDMLFEPPFHHLDRDGKNMAMWAWQEGFWKYKDWISVNVGVFIIRNCQWSLDLIDKWSPMGPNGPVRDEWGKILSRELKRYENYPADDQSALIYLMLNDDAVMSKIQLVEHEYVISGWWQGVVETLEESIEKYHPGLGDRRWPWITHFTGCSFCGGGSVPDYPNCMDNPSYLGCMKNFTKVYNFAEDQVMAYMGYKHVDLWSLEIMRTRNETSEPLDFVGVNPWKDKMDQLAAKLGAKTL